jgi:hypothetical protein
MATLQPKGEQLKKAIQWISDKKKEKPGMALSRLVDDASFQFDLSPKDSQFLLRFVKNDHHQNPA